MSDASSLLITRQAERTHLQLNRPDKLNALDPALAEALLAAVQTAAGDGTRLLPISGAGRNFSAGFDLSDFEQVSEGDLLLRFVRIEQLLQAVYHAPFQTLALAHGRNFGAGVDLICACNRRIAAPGSSFRMPGLRFGLLLGSRRFAHRVGTDVARDILLRSHQFDAGQAQAIGFIQHTAEQEEWQALQAQAGSNIAALSAHSTQRLLEITATDTRAQDMADLVTSASAPGLKERLRIYRQAS
jgi:enoyl-CoA hydratase